jgi:hypothetical protein
MGLYRLREGAAKHYERLEDGGVVAYRPGQTIESDKNLLTLYPNKFEKVSMKSGAKDAHAKRKMQASKTRAEEMAKEPPVRGLPTKRTRSPLGPEETPNTKSEIDEVHDALEEGDTEDEVRVDDEDRVIKSKKPRAGFDESTGEEEADELADYTFKPKKGKGLKSKKAREEEADEEEEADDEEVVDEDEEETEDAPDDESDDDEEEEDAPVKKKVKTVKVKKKKSKK